MKKKNILLLAMAIMSLSVASCDNTNSNNSNNTSNGNISNSTSTSSGTSDIEEDIHVISLNITNKNVGQLNVGGTYQLNVSVLPVNATNKIVNYSSSNNLIATVSFTGLIQAKSIGKCTITAESDDGGIKDTIEIEVVDSDVKNFDVKFDESVETIESGNNTFYKLVLGREYPLTISFDSKNDTKKELEVEFSLDGFCSFDASKNTLKPLKHADSLIVTFKLKNTNLKKEYYLKIVNDGEKDITEIINKLTISKNKEDLKDIKTYHRSYDFDTLDVYENRTHYVEDTTYNIFKESSNRYMLGDRNYSAVVTLNGKEPSAPSTLKTELFMGMSDGNYYKFEVDENGNHIDTPKKLAIVESVSDRNTQITRDEAIKQSTRLIMNSRVGLSDMALMQFSGLCENSIGYGSLPLYFGGEAQSHTSIVEKDNVVVADSYYVENKPSILSPNGEVYFNHGEYTFDGDTLVSIDVTSYVYDNTYYDFDSNKLSENAKYIEMYKIKLSQEFGSLNIQDTNKLDPKNLYFNDFTPILVDGDGNKVTKAEVGETYNISFENPSPSIATNFIDTLIIDDSSDKEVVSITNNGKSITINKSGVSTLTVFSSKNNISRELVVSVDVTMPNSISIFVNNEKMTQTEIFVGDKLDNISYEVLPSNAPSDVNVVLNGVGTLKKNNNNTYSFTSDVEGEATIVVTSKLDSNIKAFLKIIVNKKSTSSSLIDTLLANTYVCYDSSVYGGAEIPSNSIVFKSATKVEFKIESSDALITYIIECDVIIDEQNKTITFTSFNVTNDPDEAYESFYLPLIKLNVPYNISNDGKSFAINLYTMDGVDELPFVNVGELANFEIKK